MSRKLENTYKDPYIVKKSSDRMKKWIQCSPKIDEFDPNEDEDVLVVRMDGCNNNNRGCDGE